MHKRTECTCWRLVNNMHFNFSLFPNRYFCRNNFNVSLLLLYFSHTRIHPAIRVLIMHSNNYCFIIKLMYISWSIYSFWDHNVNCFARWCKSSHKASWFFFLFLIIMFNLHLTHMFIIIIIIHLSSSFNPQRFHLRPAEVSIITVCFMLFLYCYFYVFLCFQLYICISLV